MGCENVFGITEVLRGFSVKMNDTIDYHIADIAKKLLSLKTASKMSRQDQETIAEILDTDIVVIQELLKNDNKT